MSLRRRVEHLRYRRYLDAAVDDELPADLARRVRAHVAACGRCSGDEDLTFVIKRRLGLLRLLPPRRRRCDDDAERPGA